MNLDKPTFYRRSPSLTRDSLSRAVREDSAVVKNMARLNQTSLVQVEHSFFNADGPRVTASALLANSATFVIRGKRKKLPSTNPDGTHFVVIVELVKVEGHGNSSEQPAGATSASESGGFLKIRRVPVADATLFKGRKGDVLRTSFGRLIPSFNVLPGPNSSSGPGGFLTPPLTPKEFADRSKGASPRSRMGLRKLNRTPAGRALVLKQQLANSRSDKPPTDREVVEALAAKATWSPSAESLARGASVKAEILSDPEMLTVEKFAERSHRSRESIKKDIDAIPRRLLAVQVGTTTRVPEWQLKKPVRKLVGSVLSEVSEEIDNWALYFALTRPLPGLDDQSPVGAVQADGSQVSIDCCVAATLAAMDIHVH